MQTESKLRLADVFVTIPDPRQAWKVEHDLVELLVVAVNAVLVGADTFVEIELWAKEKIEWLRKYLRLANGIPSHDTFGRLFGLIDAKAFEAAFRRWVSGILPVLGAEVVAVDGKTSRRSGRVDATALHLVSAFAAGAGLVLGQQATAEKSNEKTAIPELLSALALSGCIVTIDAMGTQANIAQAVCDQLDCLYKPQQWPELKSFVVIDSERSIQDKTTRERRVYISSLAPEAQRIGQAVRAHWSIENRLHWCMDVIFQDDQMRARTGHAAHNLAVLKHITLNLIRLDPVKRKGGIKARRLIAATSDAYRAELLGLA